MHSARHALGCTWGAAVQGRCRPPCLPAKQCWGTPMYRGTETWQKPFLLAGWLVQGQAMLSTAALPARCHKGWVIAESSLSCAVPTPLGSGGDQSWKRGRCEPSPSVAQNHHGLGLKARLLPADQGWSHVLHRARRAQRSVPQVAPLPSTLTLSHQLHCWLAGAGPAAYVQGHVQGAPSQLQVLGVAGMCARLTRTTFCWAVCCPPCAAPGAGLAGRQLRG